ncbi:PREDICTED: serine/arginine-rich splicing factor SR45-like [Vollenhovia emeryi]|uniref:serine/arginine-rich splicing factor SR45-like n=1 Tax=Vollenhovia emeryi TaxID=411798 RepID=UPI0005F3F1AB|nr:PREDICTED: serine/arginine-rich splicing factor SR45-like [Vollenhovia emeryi]
MAVSNNIFCSNVEGGEEVETGAQPQTHAAVAQGAQGGATGDHQPGPSGEPSGPRFAAVEVEYVVDEEEDPTGLGAKIRTRTKGSPSPKRTGGSPTPSGTSDGEGETTSVASSEVVDDQDDPARVVDSEEDSGSDASDKSHLSKSGATKRSRSSRRRKGAKYARSQGGSSEEEENPLPEKKDGRGRPPTTGKDVLMAERKKAQKDLNKANGEWRDTQRAMQGGYDPRKYEGAERRKKVRELEEQIPQLPTRDLVAEVVKHSSRIDEAVSASKNLKGTLAGMIREGALFTRIAIDALNTRLSGRATETEELLREELASLKAQVADLLREKEEWNRRAMPPPHPPQTGGNATPSGEDVREEMPEVVADGLPMDPPPPGKMADPAPPEKRTWEVVTPRDTSRASTSGAGKTQARKRERSASRKRANPPTPGKSSPCHLPTPRRKRGNPCQRQGRSRGSGYGGRSRRLSTDQTRRSVGSSNGWRD